MSPDARLRSLERSAASGDLDSQARSLLERVRAGTLTRERLELAAYCGDAAARLALNVEDRASWPACGCEGGYGADGPGACVRDGPLAHLGPWVRGLGRWGRPVLVRGLFLLCEEHARAVGYWTWPGPCPLETVQAWLAGDPMAAPGATLPYGEPLWAWWLVCAADAASKPWPGSFDSHVQSCLDAILPDLQRSPVREEASVAVLAWALGPSPSPPAPHVDPDPETTGA